jgi:hypothetical protein
MTKTQYRDELKLTIPVLTNATDVLVEKFIDIALRAYSDYLPQLLTETETTVVAGQTLYDLPTGTLKVVAVKSSATKAGINFKTVDKDGAGRQIEIGTIQQKSYSALLSTDFYQDPLIFGSGVGIIGSAYSAFDIEYTALQTMASIADTGLKALTYHIEYQSYNNKSLEITTPVGSMDYPESISDSDSSGNSQSVTLMSADTAAKFYASQADKSLKLFESEVCVPYLTQG